MIWTTAAPAIGAAFLASLVEVVEAFTIVLAVWTLNGRRPAILGSLAALAVLALIIVTLGPLLSLVPIAALQLVIGTLLLLFGLGWLRKAALRAGGVIALHDEALIFARQTEALGRTGAALGGIVAFKAVLLEGLEVVFIVIAVGSAQGLLIPASLGAALACALVLGTGALVHRPLARVPENTLKFVVGVMLSSFGVFWTGEGLGIDWPGGDLALFVFAALFLLTGLGAAAAARRIRRGAVA